VIAQVMAGCAAAPKLAPDKPVPPA
jgi:hypothetical protein